MPAILAGCSLGDGCVLHTDQAFKRENRSESATFANLAADFQMRQVATKDVFDYRKAEPGSATGARERLRSTR